MKTTGIQSRAGWSRILLGIGFFLLSALGAGTVLGGGYDGAVGKRLQPIPLPRPKIYPPSPSSKPLHPGLQSPEWNQVEQAMQQGRPRTALAALEPILKRTRNRKQWAEWTRAFLLKIRLEADLQGGQPEEKILRLQKVLPDAPAPTRPILQTVLAEWYWQYFQANRWRFLQRTAVQGGVNEKDLRTWDLRRIFREIDFWFTRALRHAFSLQKIPIEKYRAILQPWTAPTVYRPTLYDFLAYEALEFYTSGEQAGVHPEQEWEIQVTDPIFDPPEQFLRWKLPEQAEGTPLGKAVQLYQDLLRFHLRAGQRAATAEADWQRLRFGNKVAVGEGREARYQQALQQYVERWKDFPLAAQALHAWAQLLYQKGEYVEARRIAIRAVEHYPDTPGGRACQVLIRQIEAPRFSLETERVWWRPWPSLVVRYRNATNLTFRLVSVTWSPKNGDRINWYKARKERLQEWLKRPAEKEWQVRLPPTPDFRERTVVLPVPRDLPPGYYVLLGSLSQDEVPFESEDFVYGVDVWVSRLALVIQRSEKVVEGWVLDNETGEPVPRALVEVWSSKRLTQPLQVLTTDSEGHFVLPGKERGQFYLRLRVVKHSLVQAVWAWTSSHRERASERTFLFTDRAIYRPGQVVFYKGICVRIDRARNTYRTLARCAVEVTLFNANGKPVAKHRHLSNGFGSFSGEFVLPETGLPGRYRLQVTKGPGGSAGIRVEEYKRPKFFVQLALQTEQPRLGQTVEVRGQATAYAGYPVDQGRVRYRIVRRTWIPWWCRFLWGIPSFAREAQIAHGTTRLRPDGSFILSFPAKPDPKLRPEAEPVFTFEVRAEVTDRAGETRVATLRIPLGYRSVRLHLNVPAWMNARRGGTIQISAQNLAGEPVALDGELRIYALQQPEHPIRPPLGAFPRSPLFLSSSGAPVDSSKPTFGNNPLTWPKQQLVYQTRFQTDVDGFAQTTLDLAPGLYRVEATAKDAQGKPVQDLAILRVLDPQSSDCPLMEPFFAESTQWRVEPGDTFLLLWGSGYRPVRACVEIFHRRQLLRRFWIGGTQTNQTLVRIPVKESFRGGFSIVIWQVRENRFYHLQRRVEVPWSNKELELSWEHFRSKLQPGGRETWTLVVKPKKPVSNPRWQAEVLAEMFDRSLDVFVHHQWPRLDVFYRDWSIPGLTFRNQAASATALILPHSPPIPIPSWTYPDFDPELIGRVGWGGPIRLYAAGRGGVEVRRSLAMRPPPPAPGEVPEKAKAEGIPAANQYGLVATDGMVPVPQKEKAKPEEEPLPLSAVRTNLQETAFFYPHLLTDSNGTVRISFEIPQALTGWRVMVLAHDPEVRWGYLESKVVTAKDLMVLPNPPRFLREGDQIFFPVRVVNRTDRKLKVRVQLQFLREGKPDTTLLPADYSLQTVEVPARRSRVCAWKIHPPDRPGLVAYRVIAAADGLSDGEEDWLPILSQKIAVTESMPLFCTGPEQRTFVLTNLARLSSTSRVEHVTYVVQVASNPTWYAVMALPYLIEYPYECSEQLFNRFYALQLGQLLVQRFPELRQIFAQWQGTEALASPLEKNSDLKSIFLDETPWVRDAESETEAHRRLALYFQPNVLSRDLQSAWEKLVRTQRKDGFWPWFPGGPANPYITLYIVSGFARLKALGVDVDLTPAHKAIRALDQWMIQLWEKWQKQKIHACPSPETILYLYARGLFQKEVPLDPKQQKVVNFFLDQAEAHWLELPRMSQGYLALAALDWNRPALAHKIAVSLKERSIVDPELGRFWRDPNPSWFWYRAPIETQALMIEVFDRVLHDTEAANQCRVWLLKQKQTQAWPTTKATAEAVYALLAFGEDWLQNQTPAQVRVGSQWIQPAQVEAGTGFYEVRFPPKQITPAMARVTLRKIGPGIAWGGVYWEYLQDLSQIQAHRQGPLTIEKQLFIKRTTPAGEVLKPVQGPLRVGDRLVSRLIIRVDRDMEFVHIQDMRPAGAEPDQVLSGYRWREGLGYYMTVRDSSTHYFIDYLPRGTYVLENTMHIQHRGRYQAGMARIECLYAPEFSSHTASTWLEVH